MLNQYPEKNCESYHILYGKMQVTMHQTKFCNSYNETIRPFNTALENICQRTANVTICHILQSLGANLGGHYSADWTTGLEYCWTGLTFDIN